MLPIVKYVLNGIPAVLFFPFGTHITLLCVF